MRLNIFNLNFREVITQKLVDILFRIYINLQRFHNIFEFSPEAKNFLKHFSVIYLWDRTRRFFAYAYRKSKSSRNFSIPEIYFTSVGVSFLKFWSYASKRARRPLVPHILLCSLFRQLQASFFSPLLWALSRTTGYFSRVWRYNETTESETVRRQTQTFRKRETAQSK